MTNGETPSIKLHEVTSRLCAFISTEQFKPGFVKGRQLSWYFSVQKTDIEELLRNSTCGRHRPPSCRSKNPDFVGTLFTLACRMKRLSNTTFELGQSVEASINCYCGQGVQKRKKRETNSRLCKAMVSLSNIDECYQLLYIKYGDKHQRPASSVS